MNERWKSFLLKIIITEVSISRQNMTVRTPFSRSDIITIKYTHNFELYWQSLPIQKSHIILPYIKGAPDTRDAPRQKDVSPGSVSGKTCSLPCSYCAANYCLGALLLRKPRITPPNTVLRPALLPGLQFPSWYRIFGDQRHAATNDDKTACITP